MADLPDDFEFDEEEEERRLRAEAAERLKLAEAFRLVREHRARRAAQGSSSEASTEERLIPPSRLPQRAWLNFVPAAIDEAGRGLRTKDILLLARERFKEVNISPVAAAHAMRKLVAKDVLVHRGTRYYTPSLVELIGEENLATVREKDGAREREHGIIVEAILGLEGLGVGMTSPEILAALKAHPRVGERVERASGSVYNALKRLTDRGKLERDGASYRLVDPQTNEAPDESDASSGQVNGADDPSLGSNPARPVH